MILEFVTNFILPPIIEALGSESISRAYTWWTAPDCSDHEAQLTKLRNSLENVQCRVDDAEQRQGRENPVRLWLQDFRRLAYDVEDVEDECDYEHLRFHAETRGEKKRKRSSDIVEKIQGINVRFDDLMERADLLKLEPREFHPTAMQVPEKTDSLLGDSKVFGREEDVSRILDMLDDLREKQYLVSGVSLVGMGGLGKTTVAKLIYKKAKEERRYNRVAWVCVSEEFDEETILGELYQHLKRRDPPSSVNVLVEDLAKELEGKTFLLVLDDVWNKDGSKWNAFNNRLTRILKTTGNSILVTTRDRQVAYEMMKMNLMQNAMQIDEMHKLSNDECWSIIEKTVLKSSGKESISSYLEAIGVEIAKKCRGLPLVATIIGGTLSREIQAGKWEAIRDNDAWNLNSKDGEKILSILKISFDHLLPPLKKCFSYCSIFSKDFVIKKDALVQLWMAQGYLQQPNESSRTMEEIGDAYFSYLLSNSLFQDVERTPYGDVISCKMHDVVHDLALAVSKDETLILKPGAKIDKNATILHLRVKLNGSELPYIPTDVCQRLRSLFIEGKDDVIHFLSALPPDFKHGFSNGMQADLKRLRVLSLHGARITELPFCFDNMKSLRFLDISETKIKELSKSISKLCNLQTFRFMGYLDLKMPLEGTGYLINLRHIHFGKGHMPANIGRLTSLVTLGSFDVRTKKGFKIEELGSLSRLKGILVIYNLDLVKDKSEAEGAKLHEKAVNELQLWWSGRRESEGNHDDVLEGLQPHQNLQTLEITNYRGKNLPSWLLSSNEFFSPNNFNLVTLSIRCCNKLKSIPVINGLSSLKQLTICYCSELTSIADRAFEKMSLEIIDITDCPKLESLGAICHPGLKKLSIGGFSEELEESCIHHSHASLEDLSLVGWRKLPHQIQHVTALRELQIWRLSNMDGLPEWLGNLSSLENLTIYECRNVGRFLSAEVIRRLTKLKELRIVNCVGDGVRGNLHQGNRP